MSDTAEIAPSVLAEIQAGTGQGIAAAGRSLPGHRGGSSIAGSTVWRWIMEGIPLANGTRLRLEAVRVGGRWLTSKEAVARFVAAATADHFPQVEKPVPSVRKLKSRQTASKAAAKRCEAIGA